VVLPVGFFIHPVLFLLIPFRWLSLVIVMAGVSLVGYSGSLIKDAVKQATLHLLSSPGRPAAIQGQEPELTKAVVGTSISELSDHIHLTCSKVFSSSCLPKSCRSIHELCPSSLSSYSPQVLPCSLSWKVRYYIAYRKL